MIRSPVRGAGMRRRQFLGLLSSAVAWPVTARAQPIASPVVGFLNIGSPEAGKAVLPACRKVLTETGYVEGRNLTIEYRWADGAYDLMPALAKDLVDRHVNAIFAGAPPAAMAAKTATATIPIVFTSGGNPVELGLVSSLNRPGANVTGVSFLTNELAPKRLELLRE